MMVVKMEEMTFEQLDMLLADLPPGRGVQLKKSQIEGSYDLTVHKVVTKDLEQLAEDESKFHIVFSMDRIGVKYYSKYMEYKYFPPDTSDGPNPETEYEFRLFRWRLGMAPFSIMTIPFAKKQIAYDVAKATHMEISNITLFYVDYATGKRGRFPMHNPKNCFLLRNEPGDVWSEWATDLINGTGYEVEVLDGHHRGGNVGKEKNLQVQQEHAKLLEESQVYELEKWYKDKYGIDPEMQL